MAIDSDILRPLPDTLMVSKQAMTRKRLLLPILYMTVILLLSSLPGNTSSPDQLAVKLDLLSPFLQNFLHIPLYGGLMFCWFWSLLDSDTRVTTIQAGAAISILFAAVDESFQSTVPGRTMSALDFVLDITGVLIASALLLFRKRIRMQSR